MRKKYLLLLGGSVVAVLLAEGILRLLPVEFSEQRLVRDGVLGWKNRPNWRCERFSINSRGFIGEEFAPRKQPGVTRIFCLGDSCVAGDYLARYADSFPCQLAAALERTQETGAAAKGSPPKRFEVINAAVGGYSSDQGLRWLRGEIVRYQPDFVTVSFGWNDHWLARVGGSDKQVSGSATERARAALSSSKLFQLVLKAYQSCRRKRNMPHLEQVEPASVVVPANVRVPPEDFRTNLAEIVDTVRAIGAEAILMTTPNYLELAPSGKRRELAAVFGSWETAEKLVQLHDRYNQLVKEVAAARRAPLVDGTELFRAREDVVSLFERPPGDFVHPSPAGFQILAEAVARTIRANAGKHGASPP